MGEKLSSRLIKRAHEAAVRNRELSHAISQAMRERYGATHSDVDCDPLIDALDYGTGALPTLADCDDFMAASGAPKLETNHDAR